MAALPKITPAQRPDTTSTYRLYQLIREAGANIRTIIRVLPPIDTGHPVEALYIDYEGNPHTAIFQDPERTPVLREGW